MKETQQTIAEWGAATFGIHTPLQLCTRMNVEVAELVSAIDNNASKEKIAEEIADVWIVLVQVLWQAEILVYQPRSWQAPDQSSLILSILVQHCSARLMERLYHGMLLEPTVDKLLSLLQQLSEKFGVPSLGLIVDQKMQVNRARSWGKTDTGRMQHLS